MGDGKKGVIWLFQYVSILISRRGPFAALLAMVKAHYPTNIILDIIEKALEEFQVNSSAWQ